MTNITVGRYDGCTITQNGAEKPLTDEWAGYVEGIANDGTGWIIYLDGDGRPALYWPHRDAEGGVIGDPIKLG